VVIVMPVSTMQHLNFTQRSGMNITLQQPDDATKYVKSFLTTDILSTVVQDTNQTAAQHGDKSLERFISFEFYISDFPNK